MVSAVADVENQGPGLHRLLWGTEEPHGAEGQGRWELCLPCRKSEPGVVVEKLAPLCYAAEGKYPSLQLLLFFRDTLFAR